MKRIFFAISFICLSLLSIAQQATKQEFVLEISRDTILLGNYFEVRFTAVNIKGEFEAPAFSEFELIGGPNQSSTMSIVNGVSSQKVSYSYFLKPKDAGTFYIEPAYLLNKDEQYETAPREILCLPNPEGIVQESRITDQRQSFDFGEFPFLQKPDPIKPKKKLKVTKI
ncbi:MAG: hypothetical protein HKN76_10700 [Saprospiraceae bacterium]|nr:hypothetical protein [Saprospiraceae bacterium]